MNSPVASEEHLEFEKTALKAAWNAPRLRSILPAKSAQADHGENHFDGVGFS